MKIFGVVVIVGWLFFVALASCTVGGDRSKTASIGESCASKQCQAPASCLQTSEGSAKCYITCSGAEQGINGKTCPAGMECAIPTFAPQYICIRSERSGW